MPLATGVRLGPYEILGLVGSGGMGEVYRARDPRLGRDVAVKVLPDDLAADADRLHRFEQEARAVAALSHPDVVVVHDVGTDAGRPYVVAELLEGETLGERLRKGALSVREAVETAVHVARGLAAVHAKGIAHRDLKPANVFLTTDGRVKILDFGLARWEGLSPEETTASVATEPGKALGTVGYTSPEQVRGGRGDSRSDIFSFGVLLHEMVSGRHPFRRTTGVETQAAILREEPLALSGLGLPEALERVVPRCMEKRPEDRFHSAHDLALALQSIAGGPLGRLPGASPGEPGPYPGLRPFTEELKESFFGREAGVAALWEKLQRKRMASLIGPSGVGKTSFVRAGLVPARPSGWRCVTATPGRRPFASLARALVPELSSDTEALQELVGFDDADVAVRLVSRWRRRHVGALVVVDQLEELFTLNPPEVQAAFAGLLRRLCDEADAHVLVSLRDDFFFACHAHPPLAEVFTEVTPLGPLAGEALRRALVEPAQRSGFRFEDEALVEEMCGAVEGERGALPLLAFCAAELWERRDRARRLLTRAACEEVGGVGGALAQHAEATLERIGAERQGVVREIFRNLVTARGTRAACEREELLSVFPGRPVAEEVLDALVDARLLTSYEEPNAEGTEEKGRHRIEVVHESLLKAWPRLVRWQTQDEEGAHLRDHLRQAAHLWDEKGRPADLLWSGTSFRELELWRERHPGRLTALEETFAKAMREKARRRKRLLTVAIASVIVALAGVAIAVSVSRAQAVRARDAARDQALRAEASRLVALGRLELDADSTVALAYARKSLEVHDTAEARRLALEALWRGPVATVLPLPKSQGSCVLVSTSPDGDWLACGNWGNVVTLFSADAKTTRVLSNNRNAARPRTVRFADDSRRLATFASGDPETVVWSVEGSEVARLQPGGRPLSFVGDELGLMHEPREGEKAFEYVVHHLGSPQVRSLGRVQASGGFDVDLAGARLVYSRDRAVLARPLGPGAPKSTDVEIGRHDSRVADVSAGNRAGLVVSADESGDARVWDGATHELLRELRGLDPGRLFTAPVLDARGARCAWQSLRGHAFPVWDLAGPPDAEPLLLRSSGAAGETGNGAFTSDGRWLATALGSRVAFWPLGMPWPRVLRVGADGPVAFSPDSKRIVSCGSSNTATRVYPLTRNAPAAREIRSDTGDSVGCYGLAIEPSGSHVLFAVPAWALLLAPLEGGVSEALVRVSPTESIQPVAVDGSGRWAATAACYSPDPKDRLCHVIDRRTGVARAFPLPGARADDPWSGGVWSLRFASNGRLISAGSSGLYSWDPETGANELVHPTPCGPMDGSADGRRIVVACKAAGPAAGAASGEAAGPPFDLLVVDGSTGDRIEVDSHGSDIWSVAISASGDVIATGDSSGIVRVGRREASEPHLLVGGGGYVRSLAISPDGRWIASAAGSEIRLWPMPDLSKPPLHTLPYQDLLAKLRSLTNLEVAEDSSAASGYKVEIGPFPGWEDVPTW